MHHQYSSRVSPFHAKTAAESRASGGGVILRGEDVARAPTHVGTERDERLDENRGLDGHVQRPGDVGTRERLRRAEFGDAGHETRHSTCASSISMPTARAKRTCANRHRQSSRSRGHHSSFPLFSLLRPLHAVGRRTNDRSRAAPARRRAPRGDGSRPTDRRFG